MLSQKHSGKVLVPWFNITEWKHVYNLIYSETDQDWSKALKILQIWKHRTPLLSAGVEGTLIILKALLINLTQLSTYEISHIFSTSLVRFLNLCAANSDRQGTFYKTAMQNELPKWLISLRHDIAHSHKVPSESMLLLSLKYCLEWLKQKYWDVQYDKMSDFIVETEYNTIVEDCIYIIQHLDDSKSLYDNQDLMKCVARVVKDVQKQGKKNKILESVSCTLKDEIRRQRDGSSNKIFKILIEDLVILSVECDVSDTGLKKIPLEFLQKWHILMDILYETQIMPDFILKLFHFMCDEKNERKFQEVASLWVKEIFIGLINSGKDCQNETSLSVTTTSPCMKTKEFANEVLRNLNPFTMNFLIEVLEYHEAPPQFIEDAVNLVSAFNSSSVLSNDAKIYGIEDLNFNLENLDINGLNPSKTSKSRWKLIEDTTSYINLPLGVLPHQSRFFNPVLEV